MKKKQYSVFLLIIFLIAVYFAPELLFQTGPHDTAGKLVVSYLDVGQGDSAFIEFPGGKTMLIDAGERDATEDILAYIEGRGHNKLDYILCTHPHSDHIGGMAQVIESLDVGQIYMPKAVHTSKTYEKLLLAIQEKGLGITAAKAGLSFMPEEAVEVQFLAPVGDYYEELNDYSAVVRVSYGENAFLFTGDAEELSETEILKSGRTLSADVLKVGHHGSSSSSHQAFLDAVSPEYAIISCGEDNSYGHPHKEVVERLENMYISLYQTSVCGTVAAVSDGTTIQIWTEE